MRWAITIICLIIIGASCGSEDASRVGDEARAGGASKVGEGVSTDHARAADLEQSVHAYVSALFGGDAMTVYGLRSDRCRRRESPEALQQVASRVSAAWPGTEITAYEHEFDGDIGKATYQTSIAQVNQRKERWVIEQGEWRYDDCPGVAQE